ncbi:SdiA-regulated domain-containing protein [Salinimicrobium sediminilitoris]|uniref:SdiA-regulated domain-containing protein n=1 Tax=Salinimicrobium sediminilitoris TaxID=2876715 RepID=UPI001E299B16|nr:SdiA-regulated domain-containing protein [Salinimicrobium sediminilitoris]MCC8360324.1 SdiA-regulated domain-containing protein [Salinimicrobium sediminilitoris]
MKRIGHNKTVILITSGLLLFAAGFLFTFKGEAERYRSGISTAVKVEETWKLPSLLKEVSGIAFLEPGKIACVQDERGSIFIYNLKESTIEKEIKFAGKGDYEGIAIKEDVAYVLKSNGMIYKIADFLNSAKVESFQTFFSSKNDMEGLFYDKSQDRLLLAVKSKDPNSDDQKGIYAAQLPSLQVKEKPVFKLTFKEEIFDDILEEDIGETFFPSEVAINPSSGEVLILEAREPRLLILDPSGVPKNLFRLNRKLFPQPEGLTYDTSGNLYISNEGKPATIHRVTLTPN